MFMFGTDVPTISKYLSNILAEGNLEQILTISKMETVQSEGNRRVNRNVDFYNLDAIISVDYRVDSRRVTNFRIWAASVLREYMIKGFAICDSFAHYLQFEYTQTASPKVSRMRSVWL